MSEKGKLPLPVYEKVFSAAENGFICETHENLCCLRSLTENFSSRCVRTLDRGFDANEYYHYFLKHGERFVIRAKKNGNVIYDGQTCNIMDVALRYNGAYRMDFKDKKGGTHAPAFQPENAGEEKTVPHHHQSISAAVADRGILLAMLAVGYIGLTTSVHKDSIFPAEIKECSKRIYGMPQFLYYAIGYALERVLSMSRSGISSFLPPKVKSQQISLFEYFKMADCAT